jgi:tRNA dimethylallyltransferase
MRTTTPKIAIVGPTAIGKTALAIKLAEKIAAEIISVDSMQVYRYMDKGTAKPSNHELRRIPHHLIDVVFPDEIYHAGRFVDEAKAAIKIIESSGKIPLLVGGTGLYLKGLLEGIFELPEIAPQIRKHVQQRFEHLGSKTMHQMLTALDPSIASKIHPNDSQRIMRGMEIFEATGKPWSFFLQQQKKKLPQNFLLIGLTAERTLLYERINRRSRLMIEEGLVEEVQNLLHMGYIATLHSMQSIGYRHVLEFLEKQRDMRQTIDLLARDTRRYAKRQYTWFRRMQQIEWFEYQDERKIFDRVRSFLNSFY